MSGKGKVHEIDGTIIEGIWKDGKFVRKLKILKGSKKSSPKEKGKN